MNQSFVRGEHLFVDQAALTVSARLCFLSQVGLQSPERDRGERSELYDILEVTDTSTSGRSDKVDAVVDCFFPRPRRFIIH